MSRTAKELELHPLERERLAVKSALDEKAETLLIQGRFRGAKAAGRDPDPEDVRRLLAMLTRGLRRLSWRDLPREKKTAGLALAEEIGRGQPTRITQKGDDIMTSSTAEEMADRIAQETGADPGDLLALKRFQDAKAAGRAPTDQDMGRLVNLLSGASRHGDLLHVRRQSGVPAEQIGEEASRRRELARRPLAYRVELAERRAQAEAFMGAMKAELMAWDGSDAGKHRILTDFFQMTLAEAEPGYR